MFHFYDKCVTFIFHLDDEKSHFDDGAAVTTLPTA